MAEEIELKLIASPATVLAVRSHPAVTAAARGRLRTQRIVSTYYDTPAHDLAAAGVALRVRRAGTRWLQTVKGEGDAVAGVHRRTEFEWPLSAPRLDFAKLDATPWRKLFAHRDAPYRRVFATAVRRSELPLAFDDGTRATLCLDVGEIRAGNRRAALNEIEVELESGDPSRLFELADALATDLPVRVTHTSKAQRGYALATHAEIRPRRASDAAIAPGATPQAALAAIGGECIAQIEANAEAVLAHDDPEYLHQLRVGWRRLRSLIKLVTLIASEESIAPLDEELRWLGSVLGPARDLDVFALETLPGIARQFRGQREIARLRARVGRRRRQAARAVREAIASPRFQRLLLALGAFFATLGRTSGIESESTRASDWIVPVLERRHAKLIKRTRRVHRLGPAERHRARVATKKLRYAAEFFAPLFSGKRAEAYGEALAKLQSALGRLNDIEVAGKLVDALAPKDSAKPDVAYASGIVRGWLAGRVDSELKRLRDARRVFARCEPFWE